MRWRLAADNHPARRLVDGGGLIAVILLRIKHVGNGPISPWRRTHHSGIPLKKRGLTLEFRAIWEIDIDADSPIEAAQEARAVQLRPDTTATVFNVWEHTGMMHSVDLAEQTGRLDGAELVAVKTGLRFLERARDVPASIKDVASVMLTYLERREE